MPKAILFDLDDTLIRHSNRDAAWREACRRSVAEVDRLDAEELFRSIVRTRDWFWGDPDRHRLGRSDMDAARREIVSLSLERFGVSSTKLVASIVESCTELRRAGMKLFPGATETLTSLREQGFRLALVTNGAADWQRSSIDRFDLAPFFDHIQIEGEFGVGKPDQRVYLHVLQTLGTEPSETWMVGDNLEWEVAAPQRAGIFGIWFNPSGSVLPGEGAVHPDRIISALPELLDSRPRL